MMQIHGQSKFIWTENILYVHVKGPFNTEGAIKTAENYRVAVENRPCQKFASIEVLDELSLGSPDVMAYVGHSWKMLRQNQCKALALVYANSVQSGLAEKYLPEFGKAFDNLAEAEQWVAGELC